MVPKAVTTTPTVEGEGLRAYRTTYLACRDLRHAWDISGIYHAGGEVIRELTCMRCGTSRTDHWSRSFLDVRRSYDYPDDYRLDDRPEAYEIRTEVFRRAKVYDSADAMHVARQATTRRSAPARKRSA